MPVGNYTKQVSWQRVKGDSDFKLSFCSLPSNLLSNFSCYFDFCHLCCLSLELQDFEWPLESPLDPSEFIEIEVYNFNKIFNNRLVSVLDKGLVSRHQT